MLLSPLCAALCLAVNAISPGFNVDHPTDDQNLFSKLETATSALAENGPKLLTKTQRLTQCQRTKTAAINFLSAQNEKLSGEEIFQRAGAATVLIGTAYKCDKCNRWHNYLACGVIVDSHGIIATNYHVANNETGEAMGVLTANGKFYPVTEILATNKNNDVALLRVDASDLPALPLRDNANAGASVYCYSHPANTFGCLSTGIISRYWQTHNERNPGVFMQITADYARGSSGGPILDERGNLIGLVSSTNTVFYDTGTGKNAAPSNPQMVRHNCTTTRAILDLCSDKK